MPGIGDRLGGKYRLKKLLRKGGMGVVFEAEHEDLGKLVAVKILKPELAKDERGVSRFKREARAAAAIGHRSIVDVHDIDQTEDGSLFLVMELLKGETLGQRLAREGTIDVPLATAIAGAVLDALRLTHARGIVHRDLKPDNIYLVDSGQRFPDVKVLDFGASRMVDASHPEERLTESGIVLGTPYYLSPEQARGEVEVDMRTDLYALGVILYESLSGEVPFNARNTLALARRILEAPLVPPRALEPSIPEALEAVILRALKRDLDDRYQDALEMLEALLPIMSDDVVRAISLPDEIVRSAEVSTDESDHPSQDTPLKTPERTNGIWQLRVIVGAALAVGVVVAIGLFLMSSPQLEASSQAEPALLGDAALFTPSDRSKTSAERDLSTIAGDDAVEVSSDAALEVFPEASRLDVVSITLIGVPPGADLVIDGEDIERSSNMLKAPRSSDERQLRITLADGRRWQQTIRFDEDREIRIVPPQVVANRKLGRSARVRDGQERPTPRAEKVLPQESDSSEETTETTETTKAPPPESQQPEESTEEDENTSPFHLEFKVR